MKLCKDCKYCKPDKFLFMKFYTATSQCTHPEATTIQLVSGKKLYRYCTTMRENYFKEETCGKEAKWFDNKHGVIIDGFD